MSITVGEIINSNLGFVLAAIGAGTVSILTVGLAATIMVWLGNFYAHLRYMIDGDWERWKE